MNSKWEADTITWKCSHTCAQSSLQDEAKHLTNVCGKVTAPMDVYFKIAMI